jgi:hypothetical protein
MISVGAENRPASPGRAAGTGITGGAATGRVKIAVCSFAKLDAGRAAEGGA